MNETYIKTFDQFAIYVLTAMLTSISFGSLIGFVVILFFEDTWGFISVSLLYALFTLPVNGLVAIPFSLYVDFAKKTKDLSDVKKFSLYIIAGSMAGFFYGLILLTPPNYTIGDYLLPVLFGAISASLFFFIITALKKWK